MGAARVVIIPVWRLPGGLPAAHSAQREVHDRFPTRRATAVVRVRHAFKRNAHHGGAPPSYGRVISTRAGLCTPYLPIVRPGIVITVSKWDLYPSVSDSSAASHFEVLPTASFAGWSVLAKFTV